MQQLCPKCGKPYLGARQSLSGTTYVHASASCFSADLQITEKDTERYKLKQRRSALVTRVNHLTHELGTCKPRHRQTFAAQLRQAEAELAEVRLRLGK